jgi:hypothetical protein
LARALRLKLTEEDFAELVRGKVVTKEQRISDSGRPGSKPLDVTAFIALDDVGFDRLREMLNKAAREAIGE